MFPKKTVLIISLVALVGCSSTSTSDSTIRKGSIKVGRAIGYVADAAIAVSGVGNFVWVGVGSSIGETVGEIAGDVIVYQLNPRERKKVIEATEVALASAEDISISWSSDDNEDISGIVKTQAIPSEASNECKNVTQIVNINGQESREEVKLCRQPNGSWF